MKIKPIYWIALGLALALTVAVCDGLRLRDKYSISVGKYEEALTQEQVNGKALTLRIAKMIAIVGEMDKKLTTSAQVIGTLTSQVTHKDADLVTLEGRLAGLTDKDAIIVNLKEQIAAWSSKFNLAQGVIAEKDKQIEAWAAKYAAQVTISESWKQKYESELHLRTLAEKGWKASERKLRWTRVMSNVKSGLIVGALGYIGYSAIKGK